MPKAISNLEQQLGYRFKDATLLETALTHSSYSNELKARKKYLPCNERLEFLGDSVLSIIVSEYLFTEKKHLPEGELTKMRAELVCGKSLSGFAKTVALGDYMLLGNGEERNGGRANEKILENAFEALLAAMYLDAGEEGKRVVTEFLLPLVKDGIQALETAGHGRDYKTELQQFVQQTEGDFLEYAVVDQSGPDHKKTFQVEARLNSNIIGRGAGRSKREAEQNAAKQALSLFGEV